MIINWPVSAMAAISIQCSLPLPDMLHILVNRTCLFICEKKMALLSTAPRIILIH